jgi:hypothetical protein
VQDNEKKLVEEGDQLKSDWIALWSGAPVEQEAPEAMLECLDDRDEVLAAIEDRDEAESALKIAREEEQAARQPTNVRSWRKAGRKSVITNSPASRFYSEAGPAGRSCRSHTMFANTPINSVASLPLASIFLANPSQ